LHYKQKTKNTTAADIAFFGALQPKHKKKGDNNIVAITFFGALEAKNKNKRR
jgi:hypothetical protein